MTERVGGAGWVAQKVGRSSFGPCASFHWVNDAEEIVFGVVFHEIDFVNRTCIVSVAIEDPKAITRKVLRRCADIAINEFKLRRAEFHIRADNAASIRVTEALGARLVGVRRQAELDGTDVIVYDVLREEFKWQPR